MPSTNDTRLRLKDDFKFYAEHCLKIRTKPGKVIQFSLNETQQMAHEIIEKQKRETGRVRVLWLKGRQMGASTYIGGRFLHITTHNIGIKAFILAHRSDSTDALFKMTKRFYDHLPEHVQIPVDTSNRKELIFSDGMDSSYALGTAGSGEVGRGETIQLLHCSEAAFYSNTDELTTGLLQTVPEEDGSEIIIESTANGIGNWFHSQWQKAEAGLTQYVCIFTPWFHMAEYKRDVQEGFSITTEDAEYMDMHQLTMEQMAWRANKIAELTVGGSDGIHRFRQEYPATAAEAFQTSGEDSLISPDDVLRARKRNITNVFGAHVVGVDPARFGRDTTSILHRKGRKAYGKKTYIKKSTMEVAGYCTHIIEDAKSAGDPVDAMFIDVGGLGAGVVDRLIELGYGRVVREVNFGSRAILDERYINRRAEMWGEMNEWFIETECDIPDEDQIHADLIGPQYGYDSAGRLKLEKKEDMMKRGLRSPDDADSLALTFAEKVSIDGASRTIKMVKGKSRSRR